MLFLKKNRIFIPFLSVVAGVLSFLAGKTLDFNDTTFPVSPSHF